MDQLRIKVNECSCQDDDRWLKQQFMNGIKNKAMTSNIIKKLTAIKNADEVTSEQVLAWARRMEVQRLWKDMVATIQEAKEFDLENVLKHQQKESQTKTHKSH